MLAAEGKYPPRRREYRRERTDASTCAPDCARMRAGGWQRRTGRTVCLATCLRSATALWSRVRLRGLSMKPAAPKDLAFARKPSGSLSPSAARISTASAWSSGRSCATTMGAPAVVFLIGSMSAPLRQSPERHDSRQRLAFTAAIDWARPWTLSDAWPSVRYSSSASRKSVAVGFASVPVMSSRTLRTGTPSSAASAPSTVDFPMPGSPSIDHESSARRSADTLEQRLGRCSLHRSPQLGDQSRRWLRPTLAGSYVVPCEPHVRTMPGFSNPRWQARRPRAHLPLLAVVPNSCVAALGEVGAPPRGDRRSPSEALRERQECQLSTHGGRSRPIPDADGARGPIGACRGGARCGHTSVAPPWAGGQPAGSAWRGSTSSMCTISARGGKEVRYILV